MVENDLLCVAKFCGKFVLVSIFRAASGGKCVLVPIFPGGKCVLVPIFSAFIVAEFCSKIASGGKCVLVPIFPGGKCVLVPIFTAFIVAGFCGKFVLVPIFPEASGGKCVWFLFFQAGSVFWFLFFQELHGGDNFYIPYF